MYTANSFHVALPLPLHVVLFSLALTPGDVPPPISVGGGWSDAVGRG